MATTARTRILTLDIVRGVAVMGILAMNIYAFAGPGGMYFNPAAYGGETGIDWLAWAFNFIFVDSKMRGLFSILFGASTLLVIEKAQARSRRPAIAHYARMAWLLAFGLFHFYFIWFGDILSLYAQCGLLLFFFRKKSAEALRNWALSFLTVAFLFMGVQSLAIQGIAAGTIPDTNAAAADGDGTVEAITRFFGHDRQAVEDDLDHYRSGYETIVERRTGELKWSPFQGLFQIGLETLGLMLVGMALFRSGMLSGEWPVERYRRWVLRSFAIGVPALAVLAWWQVASGYDAVTVFGATMAWSMPFDVAMAVGWAGIIILLAKRDIEGPLASRFAATGRMAFTNYLMTSIIMTSIFYGYGLGLYGDFGRAQLYLFVFAMWGLMLLWSMPWLARFHYGPLEWLWRSLSRFSPQPMLRPPA